MDNLLDRYDSFKYKSVTGRYITPDHLAELLPRFKPEVVGRSVRGEDILMITLGTGPVRILAWSQMHGNEGTTTKALADLLNGVRQGLFADILEKVTLAVIPILNPDGAREYTRVNAAAVDLNRDFVDLSQPESLALMRVFNSFSPDYCFNMHDQRTIFGAGDTGKPATISFLAPAFDPARSLNAVRMRAMEVIGQMNHALQGHLPGMVGRFDDSFNRQCAGDTFTVLGASTILFEAGHFPGDYEREISRKFMFYALFMGIKYISENDVAGSHIAEYLSIPQNKICFYDIVYKNVKINYDSTELITNFAVQFREILSEGKIDFVAEIASVGENDIFGHREYDARGDLFAGASAATPQVGAAADFSIGRAKFRNGLPAAT